MAIEFFSSEDILLKVALFVLVQALVYVILSNSSNVFSKTSPSLRSTSFRRARSVSIRRIMAALADLPAGGESSPSSSDTKSSFYKDSSSTAVDHRSS